MKQKTIVLQICFCLAVFVTVESGIAAKDSRLETLIGQISEAIRENYTLAELLELGEGAVSAAAELPETLSAAVLEANEEGIYGSPLGEEGPVQNVYAVSGGRVLKSGVREGLGMYVTVEHTGTGKISTYGHLSSASVISGERITKGHIIGSYDSRCGEDFYYALEDISGIIS